MGVAMLIALILMGVGLALLAISFWWERSFLKRLIHERVDAAFANPQDNAEELLARISHQGRDRRVAFHSRPLRAGQALLW